MHEAFEQMRKSLLQWVEIPDDAWSMMRQIFHVKKIPRQGFIKQPGDARTVTVFVCSGLLRYFSGQSDQMQVNKLFLTEGMFLSPASGCSISSGSDCGIQALEPTVALVADTGAYNALFEQHPIFDRLGRKLSTYWLEQNRTLTFQKLNATERYQQLIRQNSDLVQRVPQVHIASYLGITEVSLSRIRRQLAQHARNRRWA